MPLNSRTLKIIAGTLWFLAVIFALAASTEFKVSLKDGLFERTLQSRLPTKSSVRGVATVRIDEVIVGQGPELKMVFRGAIADARTRSAYSLELAYRIELEGHGIHVIPFMPDQKLDGHEFTVAQEVLPDLFNVITIKPIHVIKKSQLLGLHVSEVHVKDDKLRVTLVGYTGLGLGLSLFFVLLGGVAWWVASRMKMTAVEHQGHSDHEHH